MHSFWQIPTKRKNSLGGELLGIAIRSRDIPTQAVSRKLKTFLNPFAPVFDERLRICAFAYADCETRALSW
jgi:hypothetical protein